jgi:hypothetical protein
METAILELASSLELTGVLIFFGLILNGFFKH